MDTAVATNENHVLMMIGSRLVPSEEASPSRKSPSGLGQIVMEPFAAAKDQLMDVGVYADEIHMLLGKRV